MHPFKASFKHHFFPEALPCALAHPCPTNPDVLCNFLFIQLNQQRHFVDFIFLFIETSTGEKM
jgi:hypothetical protein